jgi:3-oxoacyl-[acyl-carrier-protein] synthase-3
MCTQRLGGASILGIGSAVPDNVVTNRDLEKLVDTTDQWILGRTGIRERRIGPEDMCTSDLCEKAALQALDHAGVAPSEIEMVIVGTTTPDFLYPSLASIVQHRIGAPTGGAFDVQAACSGFLYALTIADQFLRTGKYEKILVLGAEMPSRLVNWDDRASCVLFGDGAGAAVVGLSENPSRGMLSSCLGADGSTWKMLYQPAGGTRQPIDAEGLEQKLNKTRMEGNEVYKVAVRTLLAMAKGALEEAGLTIDDIDLFVPHQANLRIIDAVGKRLGIDPEKVFVNIDRYGNTSAASIPLALREALDVGRIKEGDLILMDAFGAGASAAGVVLRW